VALAREVQACEEELKAIDLRLEELIAAVAHLVDVSERGQSRTDHEIRDATDSVVALAAAIDEVDRTDRGAVT
jgi:hypothetical protein